ncbi:MAG: hypothetical protein ACI8X5_004277 [Planctomycetota bacterium]|jgi:hypothetical protein
MGRSPTGFQISFACCQRVYGGGSLRAPSLKTLFILARAGCRTAPEPVLASDVAGVEAPVDGPQEAMPGGPSNWNPKFIHRRLSESAQETGALIDSFLSNERSTSEENDSWFQIEMSAFVEDREGVEGEVQSARI